ncbi:Splicing factor U2AF, large subunit (RRM superfamily) [Trachipleistophora hominis]|uniref:Splicing factor U2AF, large subunit (RRM superfamily) n=1 Tax=Trachipleistophora hominis TaxID=72359 RepID=L7JSR8_TRAHO|nr:Splicing factor U2AF, large subunit (RRM superfamily) [Trachipleistophora hominis]
MPLNNQFNTAGSSSDRSNDILRGIEHIDELICANLRMVYDPEDEIDEYNLVPQILEVVNTQKKYVLDEIEQRKIVVKNGNINEIIRVLEKNFAAFNYRRNSSGDIEILFDTQEDADKCITMKIEGLKFSRPVKYFVTTRSKLIEKPLDEKLLLGPLKTEDEKLKRALNEISDLCMFRRCYDFVKNTPTDYFVFSFRNKNVAENLCKFLSFVNVDERMLIVCRFYDNVSIVNLNEMFNDRFIVSGHLIAAKTETRVVQILNMFLPGEISHFQMVEEVKKMILQETGNENIVNVYMPLSLYSKAYCSCEGRVYVECKNINAARNVFRRLGGLIFNGRVVITSFFPELHYEAREFM